MIGAHIGRQRLGSIALGLLIGSVAIVGTSDVARAGPLRRPPIVELGSVAQLVPDGESVTIEVIARCPLRWRVLEASVTVSQPQASGTASFPLQCDDLLRPFRVTVETSSAAFGLGTVQASAVVQIERGRTEQVTDTAVVPVEPLVLVDLADTARLDAGGSAVLADVTVACPIGSIPQPSTVNVGQPQAFGQGTYTPTCDGGQHTFNVRVTSSDGQFAAGTANAGAIGVVEVDGNVFYGQDLQALQLI